jgi:hypothetical protein
MTRLPMLAMTLTLLPWNAQAQAVAPFDCRGRSECWFTGNDEGTIVLYGTPESSAVPIALQCTAPGRVAVDSYLPARRGERLRKGEPVEVTMGTTRVAAKVSDCNDGCRFEVTLPAGHPALTALAAGEGLRWSRSNGTQSVPAGDAGLVAALLRRCR